MVLFCDFITCMSSNRCSDAAGLIGLPSRSFIRPDTSRWYTCIYAPLLANHGDRRYFNAWLWFVVSQLGNINNSTSLPLDGNKPSYVRVLIHTDCLKMHEQSGVLSSLREVRNIVSDFQLEVVTCVPHLHSFFFKKNVCSISLRTIQIERWHYLIRTIY